jgi:hypothetical protein
METLLVPFVEVFRRAISFIEDPETARALEAVQSTGDDLPRETAIVSLVWTGRQLKAITLLFENGCTLEAEPLIRALVESTINLAWVGRDAERAKKFHNDGLKSLKTWIDAMLGEEPGYLSPEALDPVRKALARDTGLYMPKLLARATETRLTYFKDGLMQRAYHFSYRRLSASTHADSRLFDQLTHEPKLLALLDAAEVAAMASVAIACAGDVLGIEKLAVPIAKDLFETAKARGGQRHKA